MVEAVAFSTLFIWGGLCEIEEFFFLFFLKKPCSMENKKI